VEKELEPAER
jgi:hypothetical protein